MEHNSNEHESPAPNAENNDASLIKPTMPSDETLDPLLPQASLSDPLLKGSVNTTDLSAFIPKPITVTGVAAPSTVPLAIGVPNTALNLAATLNNFSAVNPILGIGANMAKAHEVSSLLSAAVKSATLGNSVQQILESPLQKFAASIAQPSTGPLTISGNLVSAAANITNAAYRAGEAGRILLHARPIASWSEKYLQTIGPQSAYSNAITSWQTAERKMHTLLARDYLLPVSGEIPGILGIAQSVGNIQQASGRFAALSEMFASINKPWLDIKSPAYSIAGITTLSNIATKLDTHVPFGKTIPALLRENVGDWRKDISLPVNFTQSNATRQQFYEKVGVDHTIAAFPEASYGQILEVTKLGKLTIDLREFPEPNLEALNLDQSLKENNDVYRRLLVFEIWIRKVIDEAVTKKFGANWYKQNMPADIYQNCNDRKQKWETTWSKKHTGSLMDFADFPDYQTLVMKRDFWREVFKPMLGNARQEDIKESFQRLMPIRIEVAHARPIDNVAACLAIMEIGRLYKGFGVK